LKSIKGYLSKYVNLAKGWRSRWFVLDNGSSGPFSPPCSH
jgi:hypothetical protein